MKTIKTILYIVLALNIVACENIDPKSTSQSKPSTHTLTRKRQMTKRFDCNGNVISEKIETINSVSKRFLITAERKEHLWDFWSKAINTEESVESGILWGNQGVITVDIAPTLLHLRVTPGLNEIRYKFSYCYDVVTEIDPETDTKREKCAHGPVYGDEKSLWLDIQYKVVKLDGVREISPSKEECSEK